MDKKHVVHLENGQLKETSAADVDALFAAFSAHANKDKLVVHFHGGLVSKAGGLKIAADLEPEYSRAGAYPVFFVWESGWHETLLNNLGEIVGEDFFKALLKLVAGKVMDKLGVDESGTRGVGLTPTQLEMELARVNLGQEPFSRVDPGVLPATDVTLSPSEEDAFTQDLKQDPDFNRAVDAIVEQIDDAPPGTAARGLASGTTHISPDVLAEVRAEKDPAAARAFGIPFRLVKGAIVVLVKVVARFARKRDHGVHATIVEEILREFYAGDFVKRIWELMKKDTADSFGPDARRFGGTAMLAGIKALADAGRTPRILLVGHSTGAVYICNWLRAADEMLPPGVKFEVAFLAPACTMQLFARTLEAHSGRISKFRMFSMKDELEQRDPMLGENMKLLYPRSLLYFISGVLEEKSDFPVAGMQRFYSGARPFEPAKYPEIARVRQFLDATPDSRVWSLQDGMPGRNSDSAKHVDFDDRTTVVSLRHIIGNGF